MSTLNFSPSSPRFALFNFTFWQKPGTSNNFSLFRDQATPPFNLVKFSFLFVAALFFFSLFSNLLISSLDFPEFLKTISGYFTFPRFPNLIPSYREIWEKTIFSYFAFPRFHKLIPSYQDISQTKVFLSDPGIPGVRSMGPSLCNWLSDVCETLLSWH